MLSGWKVAPLRLSIIRKLGSSLWSFQGSLRLLSVRFIGLKWLLCTIAPLWVYRCAPKVPVLCVIESEMIFASVVHRKRKNLKYLSGVSGGPCRTAQTALMCFSYLLSVRCWLPSGSLFFVARAQVWLWPMLPFTSVSDGCQGKCWCKVAVSPFLGRKNKSLSGRGQVPQPLLGIEGFPYFCPCLSGKALLGPRS